MDLAELIELVEKATGPDREIDRLIAGRPMGTTAWRDIPTYTASLDAVIGLIEEKLPGWNWASGNCGEHDIPWACVTEPVEPCRDFASSHVTEPLALCAAFLRALEDRAK